MNDQLRYLKEHFRWMADEDLIQRIREDRLTDDARRLAEKEAASRGLTAARKAAGSAKNQAYAREVVAQLQNSQAPG
jgi:hypothetical protein